MLNKWIMSWEVEVLSFSSKCVVFYRALFEFGFYNIWETIIMFLWRFTWLLFDLQVWNIISCNNHNQLTKLCLPVVYILFLSFTRSLNFRVISTLIILSVSSSSISISYNLNRRIVQRMELILVWCCTLKVHQQSRNRSKSYVERFNLTLLLKTCFYNNLFWYDDL